MRSFAKQLIAWVFGYDPELARVRLEVARIAKKKGRPLRILDFGCGYGRYLRVLGGDGHELTGVDQNRAIVDANIAAGLHCITPTEMENAGQFDAVLLAHVISHIEPFRLLSTIDLCIDRLREEGTLIICTPLLSPWFYEDFDIVKPYQPSGILMVFGGGQAQVQYYARNRLRLVSVWYRRGYFRCQHWPARYMRSWRSRIVLFTDFVSAFLFRLSCGLIGRRDGWVGVFEKS